LNLAGAFTGRKGFAEEIGLGEQGLIHGRTNIAENETFEKEPPKNKPR
jgi:hypothetical protein